MGAAMRPRDRRLPDRVPVMCQLALGHYFLQTGLDPVDIWHDTATFARALRLLQQRYGFDGILVNLPGRDPDWRRFVRDIEDRGGRRIVRWSGGMATMVPPDDNAQVVDESGRRPRPALAAVDPDRLYYVEPHDLAGVTYPQRWGFDDPPATPGPGFFPPWHWDTIWLLRADAPELSIHGEVFSPFSQWIELLGIEPALLATADDPGRMLAALDRLAEGAAALARGHFDAGADAVAISSAYAGGGFISRRHYERFVLPFERALIAAVKESHPGRPIYTHTCGAIGDRLDLMEATGTDGIDTLDPPPLGTVELADAKRQLNGRLFIKGNVDPVNTILRGTPDACYQDARQRIAIAAAGGGYVLSTACSVPPHAPPQNILQLARAASDAA
jgi:hypothetical protein